MAQIPDASAVLATKAFERVVQAPRWARAASHHLQPEDLPEGLVLPPEASPLRSSVLPHRESQPARLLRWWERQVVRVKLHRALRLASR